MSRLCAVLWLCGMAMAFSVPAQNQPSTTTRTNRLSSDRVLAILDISAGMQKRADNLQRVVDHLFLSGFNGQLRPGDTIGMWTYNDSLHTGEFPLQRWTPQSARQIASLAAQFAQNQRYSKPSNFSPVMAQLTNVVADSDRITVVLISDGSSSPSGTPFDSQIAESFKLNAAEQFRQAMPFVTVLRAVKGEFIGFKVNTPPWPIEYPPFPPEPIVAPAQSTNPPVAKVESPKPVAPVATNKPKPVIPETNQPSPPPVITNPPVVVAPPTTPAAPPSNPPPPTVATSSSAPTTNVGRTLPPTNTANAVTPSKSPVSEPSRSLATLPVIVGGTALIGLAILCLVLLRRARRPARVSLITRSMNKDRK
ncbi:MAG TPA: hypothetical protein VFZ59_12180 [Verrucomicrobiae bacterium]|nr:hypothetical protein [Verrucomicrobiae bacterium]